MIELDRVTLTVSNRAQTRTVLSSASLTIPSDRQIGLFGPSNDDNKLLINLLSGMILPRAGRVARKARVSFPVGHLGGFVPNLPVRINVAHLARLYDADVETTVGFVESVAGLGSAFDKPYGQLGSPAKRQLARIVAYSIPFDLYLLTEVVLRGRAPEGHILFDLFKARAGMAGMIIPMRPQLARDYCEMGLVLDRGELQLYDRVEDAVEVSQKAGTRSR